MVCTHLKQLYQLCQDQQLRLGGADLIRVVCKQCGKQEVCPSTLMDEYDARHEEDGGDERRPPHETGTKS
mgnify:CR=1 FL=1